MKLPCRRIQHTLTYGYRTAFLSRNNTQSFVMADNEKQLNSQKIDTTKYEYGSFVHTVNKSSSFFQFFRMWAREGRSIEKRQALRAYCLETLDYELQAIEQEQQIEIDKEHVFDNMKIEWIEEKFTILRIYLECMVTVTVPYRYLKTKSTKNEDHEETF